MLDVQRRQFITLLGGAAAWPVAARGQQPDRVRRIGVLINNVDNDPDAVVRVSALQKALRELGWDEGRNLQIDTRWGVDEDRVRRNAAELIALAPDVILANGPPPAMALQQATRSVPIVFVGVTDPVGMGIVQSLARPGGNATGFISAEFGLSIKWLEMLKEMAPGVRRVAVLRVSSNPSALAQFAAIQGVAPSFGVELSPLGVRDAGEIERDVGAFARPGNGGLIVTRIGETIAHRDAIIKAASQSRLPAVYPLRVFVTAGGLISYGPGSRSPGWGNIAAPGYGTLAFHGVQSDHRGWSEVGAISRKAAPHPAPRRPSRRDTYHLLDRRCGLQEAIRHGSTQQSIRRSEAGNRTWQGRGGAR